MTTRKTMTTTRAYRWYKFVCMNVFLSLLLKTIPSIRGVSKRKIQNERASVIKVECPCFYDGPLIGEFNGCIWQKDKFTDEDEIVMFEDWFIFELV